MKLYELHVDEFRAGVVRQGMTVTGVFPAVAGDPERFADTAGGQDDRLGLDDLESPLLAVVCQGSRNPLTILE